MLKDFPGMTRIVYACICVALWSTTGLAQNEPMRVQRIRVVPEDVPILNIHVDDENIKWVANTKTLYKLDAKDHAVEVPIASGEMSLLQLPGGNNDIRWNKDAMAQILGRASVTTAAYDFHQKILWIGTNGYGVFKLKVDPSLRLIEQLHIDNSKLRSDFINSIYVTKSGKIWIATEDGAVSIDRGQWTIHQKFFNILRIRGHGNELWAIGDDLIWIIDNKDNWTPIYLNRREVESEIHDIAVDPEGRVWIASNIMTSYKMMNDHYQHFGPGQYFTSQFVNYVAVDDDATIWVGTQDKGLYIIEKESTITVTTTMEKYLDCKGGTKDAAFTVRAIGGKPPYQFIWSTGATGESLSGLGPGKYVLTVTDVEGSSKIATVEVPDPFIQLTTVMDRPESDEGTEDGAASVKVTGGFPPYTYEWYSGLGEASITGVPEGDYGITVTDAAGCSAIASATVTRILKPLVVNLEQKDPIRCGGEATGTITASTSGGRSPYSYAWSFGNTPAEYLGNLKAGKYVVTVTDALGNTATNSMTLSEPNPLSPSIRIESVATANMSNGVAIVDCSGGKGPYEYLWDNGETTPKASKLAPRRHVVTVTDASGCSSEAVVDITENILPLKATISQTSDIRCAGQTTGALKVELSGGKSPFTYQWNRDGLSGDVLSGLASGDYMLTVTDAAKNTTTANITIPQPPQIVVETVAETPALSGKNEGHAIVRADGGTGRFTYLWDNGDEGSRTSSLSAGIHHVTVTDGSGCSVTAEVNIVENFLELKIALEQTSEVKCAGDATGAVDATISGGKQPYTIQWNNGQQNLNSLQSLQAGTYRVSVTDAAGNVGNKDIIINEPPPLELKVQVQASANTNTADGRASVRTTGGVPPYLITWDNGESDAQAQTLAAGRHLVTVTDANGCKAIGDVQITEDILPLEVSISETSHILCSGQASAAVQADISGGKPPYSIRWEDQSTNTSRTGLGPGVYRVEVKDVLNNTSDASITVEQPMPLTGEIVDVRSATHERIKDGKATARINGGMTPYEFVWDNAESVARAVQLSVGPHSVTVTDANGCTLSLSTEITPKILPELTAENLEKGEAVRMEKLQFEADSTNIDQSSMPTLEELYAFLYDNPTIVVEIGGHTNGLPDDDYCDKLSTARAKAVADYIIEKGIDPKRIVYKGYGKRQPIATNMTPEGRRRNQRVEVKIVKLTE